MDLINLDDLQLALKLAGVAPKKGLGQHFLIDRSSLEAIVAAADVTPEDTVLEIGPGLGVMTRLLAERARRVVAVEADPVLAELLGRDRPENLEIHQGDIMALDLRLMGGPYKVVANLPYYITNRI